MDFLTLKNHELKIIAKFKCSESYKNIMGEHIVGRLIQTSQKHQYQPGECRCFHCSAFSSRIPCLKTKNVEDWQIGSDPCCGGFCTAQPRCVHPDRDECNIGLSSKGANPLIEVEWDKKAPSLKCVYNIENIDSRNQLLAFNDKFGINNDLEAKYCTQKVTTCPNQMKECSRLKSIGEGGNECRMWFEKQPNNIRDATIQNYCLKNNTEDCKCAKRSENSTYNAMKGAHAINDGCWFSACANTSGNYLVPSNLINPQCPDKLCQVLFDIIKDGNVSIDNVQNDIECDFKPSSPPAPKPPPPKPPAPALPSSIMDYVKYAALIIGTILFLFLFLKS